MPDLLLMAELLHDSMGSLSQSLQEFIHTQGVQDVPDIMENNLFIRFQGHCSPPDVAFQVEAFAVVPCQSHSLLLLPGSLSLLAFCM